MDHTFKLLIFVKIGTREIFSLKLYFLDIGEILVQLDYLQAKKPYIHLRTTGSWYDHGMLDRSFGGIFLHFLKKQFSTIV